MTSAEQDKALRRIVGQCLYLTLTRPDICFLVNQISRSSSYNRDQRFLMSARLLKMLKVDMPPLIYRHLEPLETLYVELYTDASYRKVDNGVKST